MRRLKRNNTLASYRKLLRSYRIEIDVEKTTMSSTLDSLEDYKRISRNDSFRDFVMDVENLYCPYCEITPIAKGTGNYQVDHIRNKNHFPKLSIAWNNLTPSCSRCNGIKSNKTIILNPITSNYDDISFGFIPNGDNFKRIVILTNDNKIDRSNKALKLEEYYTNRIPAIKKEILKLRTIASKKGNDPSDFTGFNNAYGRLLKVYGEKFGY